MVQAAWMYREKPTGRLRLRHGSMFVAVWAEFECQSYRLFPSKEEKTPYLSWRKISIKDLDDMPREYVSND